ncbi:hypothetical protein BD779DRAFT_1473910 [Infundibulicybe gibba]|nr:hypothetical protein BD779DRAFT_1473910 [Infundibulicybe gibba]
MTVSETWSSWWLEPHVPLWSNEKNHTATPPQHYLFCVRFSTARVRACYSSCIAARVDAQDGISCVGEAGRVSVDLERRSGSAVVRVGLRVRVAEDRVIYLGDHVNREKREERSVTPEPAKLYGTHFVQRFHPYYHPVKTFAFHPSKDDEMRIFTFDPHSRMGAIHRDQMWWQVLRAIVTHRRRLARPASRYDWVIMGGRHESSDSWTHLTVRAFLNGRAVYALHVYNANESRFYYGGGSWKGLFLDVAADCWEL